MIRSITTSRPRRSHFAWIAIAAGLAVSCSEVPAPTEPVESAPAFALVAAPRLHAALALDDAAVRIAATLSATNAARSLELALLELAGALNDENTGDAAVVLVRAMNTFKAYTQLSNATGGEAAELDAIDLALTVAGAVIGQGN